MAKRARAVRPDVGFTLQDGQTIGAVSDESLMDEVTAVLPLLNFMGGTMSVIVARHPTGVPGESVTVGAMIQWSTNAKAEAEPVVAGAARRGRRSRSTWRSVADVERVEAMQEQWRRTRRRRSSRSLSRARRRRSRRARSWWAPRSARTSAKGSAPAALPFGRDGAAVDAAPPEIDLADVVTKGSAPDPRAPARGRSAGRVPFR